MVSGVARTAGASGPADSRCRASVLAKSALRVNADFRRNVLALRCPSNTASHATSRDLPHCKCASRGSATSRVQSGRLRANGEDG